MKTMKRHLFQSISALCLITAFSLVSCSRMEDIPGNAEESRQPAAITFTATLAPKGEDPQSKAITSGTEAGKEVLKVAWAKDEQIAIYYEKTDDSWATARAKVTAVDATTGAATIEAMLTNAKGGTAKFVYPYSLAKNGELNTDYDSQFRTQDGTIEYISQYLDAATSKGTIAVTGSTATVNGTVTMQNQVCICKFSFSGLSPATTENCYDITIREKDGTTTKNTYIALNIAKEKMGEVYMALLGAKEKDFKFSVQGNHKSNPTAESEMKYYYETISTNVTLTTGKFYRSIPVGLITLSAVTIPNGGTYTLDDATISVTSGPAIYCQGHAIIILTGSNSVTTSAEGQPAIFITSGNTLTIQGTGSLTAESTGKLGAGIGSGGCVDESPVSAAGDIIIESGTVTAKGGWKAAGIGTGYGGYCGTITINGGNITAKGGQDAAGIGDGDCGTCHGIIIGSGLTSLTATMGRVAGVPLSANGGNVTIDGKTSISFTTSTTQFEHYNSVLSADGQTWTLTKKTESNQQ